MGEQEARPATIALLVSAWIIVFASVGGEAPPRDEVTASDEELAAPETLPIAEYVRRIPNYGYNVGTPASYNVVHALSFDAGLEADALEYQTLLASLSPGVRASYRAWLLDRADAREKERERDEAERERDEAEYAAFIKEHLRRLSEDRASRK